MDPDLNKEVLDVRKVIEKSTSKVSLRDLEKKGFRQVKVLRAGDINQLIFKAVQNVLAKQPRGAGMSEEERQKIVAEAKAELDQQMAHMREIQQESQRIEAEKEQLQQAHKNLEAKLAEVNAQLKAQAAKLEQEKAAFARDKQALYEKGLEGQQSVSRQYEGQLVDLKDRLRQAEDKLHALEGSVSKAELEETVGRHKARAAELQQELQEAESRATRYKRHADQLEESEAKLQRKASVLTDDVVRLEGEVARLREELAAKPAASLTSSGVIGADQQEIQRMRFEMEQQAAKTREMITGLANALATAPRAAGGEGPDMSKQFKQLQAAMADQLRKGLGTLAKGGNANDFDLSPEAAAALFAAGKDEVITETNINTVAMKEQSAAGVKDKLSKLKNLRGGNK